MYMRKTLAFVLAVILLLSCFCVPVFAESMLVMTPGGWLNLRKGPSTREEVKQYIPNGDRVTVMEHLEDGWTWVTWKNHTGYVQSEFLGTWHDYLLKTHPDAQKAYPTAWTTYVRREKDSLSPVVKTVERDTPLTVLETDGVWSYVSFEDAKGSRYEGYVLSSSVQVSDEPVGKGSSTPPVEDMRIVEKGIVKSEQPMYMDPDIDSLVLRNVPAGTQVTVEQVQFPWCFVNIGAYVGWMMMEDVQLTGESQTEWHDRTLYNYVANHYTAKSVDGTLEFYIYPRSELDMVHKTVEWDPEKPLIVLEKAKKQYGQYWSRVWDGEDLQGWVLSSQLDIGTELKQYEYDHNVPSFSTAIAYAGENGTRLFTDGSALAEVKMTVPAGTEVYVTLNPQGYAYVTYVQEDGKEVTGYALYEDLMLGFADQTDENYPRREEDTRAEMPLEDLIALAEKALKQQYADFDAGKLTRTETHGQSPSGDQKFYDIVYFEGDVYRYSVRIHAVTGAVLRAVSYAGFHDDPLDQYTTRSDALETAVAALIKKDKNFDPDTYQMFWGYSKSGDQYQFTFADDQGETHYSAGVYVKNGKLAYARATKKDQAQLEKNEQSKMSEEKAKQLGEDTLKNRYPDFDPASLTLRYDSSYKDGVSRGEMAYYDKNGKYVYAAQIDLVTGEVLFAADYTGGDHVPTLSTPAPERTPEPGESDIGKSAARSIADSTLAGKYADFDPSRFPIIHNTRKLVMPGIGGPLYQIDYYTGDDNGYACCMVDCATGEVLYTSNQYNSDLTEIDYDPTPEPTPRPMGTDMGESAARQIADAALKRSYPEFDPAQIDWVRCIYYDLDSSGGWDKPYYQFDYFSEDGDMQYEIMVHAYTGNILYMFGGLPGEGNG